MQRGACFVYSSLGSFDCRDSTARSSVRYRDCPTPLGPRDHRVAEIKAEFKVIHERFEAVEQRMDAEFKRMDRRMAEGFSEQMNVTLMLFGSLIMLIHRTLRLQSRGTAARRSSPWSRNSMRSRKRSPGSNWPCSATSTSPARKAQAHPPHPSPRRTATNPSTPTSSTPRCSAAAGYHRSSAARFPPRIVRMNTGRFVPYP